MNIQGVKIKAVEFPLNQGTATQMTILVGQFTTTATTCMTYYELQTEEGKVLQSDNYYLSEEEFAEWGKDNNYINEIIATHLGVTIIS